MLIEHRYYGQSLPEGKYSCLTDKLEFLTVEEALADCLEVIKLVNTNSQAVIALGYVYGGLLAAWLRLKYPEYVTGLVLLINLSNKTNNIIYV